MVTLGDTLAGRYELCDVLGRGGVATVYRAVDDVLGRSVAIKVLTSQDRDRVEELRVEARLLAAIQHPNVVAVHDVIEHDDATFLVLELAEGIDLATMLNHDGPMAPDRVAHVVKDVAAALDAAHARGVLHRDVKPANIVVGDDGRARVTDFGIGRFTADDVTTGLHVRGSVAYVAPERLVGRASDQTVDVYALAAVTLEALTGQPPFPASAPAEAARSHVEATPPLASSRRPELPSAVDAVIARGLAKDPAERWQTAGEFAAELERALQPSSWSRRSMAVLGATVVVVLLASVALGDGSREGGEGPRETPTGAVASPTDDDDGAQPGPQSTEPGPAVGDASPSVAAETASPSDAPSDEPTESATATETDSEGPPANVEEAAARFRADLAAGREAGRVSRRAVDDLEGRLADVLDAIDRGQQRRIEQRLRDLRERLNAWAGRNELDVDLANELDRRTTDLEEAARREADREGG